MNLPLDGAGPSAPAAALPATEDLRPSSTTSFHETVVGAGSAHAALADDSDSSRVEGDAFFAQWTGGFGDLVSAAGRAIASFVIIVRADAQSVGTTTATPAVDGALITGDVNILPLAGPTDLTAGPFTRDGGGSFTEAMLNSVTADASLDTGENSFPRIYEITVRVTYA